MKKKPTRVSGDILMVVMWAAMVPAALWLGAAAGF